MLELGKVKPVGVCIAGGVSLCNPTSEGIIKCSSCVQTGGETCDEEVGTIDPLFIFGGHWPVWTHVWPTVHTGPYSLPMVHFR